MNHELEYEGNRESDHEPAVHPPEDDAPAESHAVSWHPHDQLGDSYQVDLEPRQPPEMTKLEPEPPQIWVGSWLDYNNGVLHGQWIDAARDDAEVWADIEAMLAESPTAKRYGDKAEDWGIFDHDNFRPLKIGEQETVSFVTAVARGIAEHGPAFAAWAEVMEDEDALAGFADAYLGEYDSVEGYVEQMVDSDGCYQRLLDEAIPDSLRGYVTFDTAALARDMQINGDLHVHRRDGGGVWLFDGRQ